MQPMIEVTCRDSDVNERMRQTVLNHAGVLNPYDDLIHLCHVVIQKRPAQLGNARAWSVRLDLVLTDGRTVAANLLDRHRWYERIDEAIDDAFRELGGWLAEVSPGWRLRRRSQREPGSIDQEPRFDDPSELWGEWPEPRVLRGTHHYVG